MARRRTKKRTHVGANNGPPGSVSTNTSASRAPKSMVIRIGAGEVGSSVSQLVKDVRNMMEPGTASRLKERRSNRLRDYSTMAGPLGVSHLLLFSRSATGNTNLRLALTPRGPTLHFRIEKYSLCKDVLAAQKHPKASGGKDFLAAPLLVMNNFTSPPLVPGQPAPDVPKHLENLVTIIFQSLFPPISPQTTPLSSVRRVLLLNRELPQSSLEQHSEKSPYTLNLRHYAITTKRTGLPRTLRRLNAAEKLLKERPNKRGGLPNLGKLEDVADYLLDPSATAGGFTSGSESEIETDAEVEVLETTTRKVLNKQQMQEARTNANKTALGSAKPYTPTVERRGVKLVELGPRMRLRMTKVEEGVCGGKVMWHEFLSKSPEQTKEMERVWEGRRKERDERQRVQRENVERKKGKAGMEQQGGERAEEDEVENGDGWDSEGFEDESEDEQEGEEDKMEVDGGKRLRVVAG